MFEERRDYYGISGVEAEDVIDNMNMLHREGAATKYLFRCNKISPKGEIREDLKKCKHYLYRCKKFNNNPIRNYTASYWLEKINPEVFDVDIYSALFEIINAVGNHNTNYEEAITRAIEHVDNAIEKY